MGRGTIDTDLDFEHFLSALFSKKRFHGRSGEQTRSQWRDQLTLIVKAIGKAARETITTDRQHSGEIERQVEYAVEQLRDARTIDQLSTRAIAGITRLALLIIGQMPTNWEKSPEGAAHSANWRLDRLRSLVYVVKDEQFFHQVLKYSDSPTHSPTFPTEQELWRQLRALNGSHKAFREWVRTNHPSVYVELV